MAILCIAPLQSELDALALALQGQGHQIVEARLGRLTSYHCATLGLVAAVGGHGKTQFAVQTQYLLDRLEVESVICFGAAGALAADLAIGDVVVATETVEHDFTQRFSRRPLPRFTGDMAIISVLRDLPIQALPFAVHFGIVASGDEDVIELERGAALREATEACAVAWEGAGGARASRFNDIPYIELRGITDTADHQASAHFAVNLGPTIAHIAELLVLWRGSSLHSQVRRRRDRI
jgi:adenosylhomocysteine nucleosidase